MSEKLPTSADRASVLRARLDDHVWRLQYLTSKNAPQLPDPNPWPRFRLWRYGRRQK